MRSSRASSDLKPQILYWGGDYAGGGLVVRQARGVGEKAPVILSEANFDPEYLRVAGPAAEGTYITFLGTPAQLLPSAQAFVKRYQARYPNDELKAYDHWGYEAMSIFLDLIHDVGPDREKILAALPQIKHQGVLGVTQFDEKGDTLNKTITIFQAVKDGKFETIAVEKSKARPSFHPRATEPAVAHPNLCALWVSVVLFGPYSEFMILQQQLVNGLTLGSLYAAHCARLYDGLRRFADDQFRAFGNLHGGRFRQSAGLQKTRQNSAARRKPFIMAIAARFLFCAVLAVVMERVAYRPLRRAARLTPLISAIGVSILLQNAVFLWISDQSLAYPQAFEVRHFHVLGRRRRQHASAS